MFRGKNSATESDCYEKEENAMDLPVSFIAAVVGVLVGAVGLGELRRYLDAPASGEDPQAWTGDGTP